MLIVWFPKAGKMKKAGGQMSAQNVLHARSSGEVDGVDSILGLAGGVVASSTVLLGRAGLCLGPDSRFKPPYLHLLLTVRPWARRDVRPFFSFSFLNCKVQKGRWVD